MSSPINQEMPTAKRWILAIIFAPLVPIVLFIAYLSLIHISPAPFLGFSLTLGFFFYVVFGPTYVFVYSRIIKENVFFSGLGGFVIPVAILLLLGGEIDVFVVLCGIFGAACGVFFDFILNGFRLNLKIEYSRELRGGFDE